MNLDARINTLSLPPDVLSVLRDIANCVPCISATGPTGGAGGSAFLFTAASVGPFDPVVETAGVPTLLTSLTVTAPPGGAFLTITGTTVGTVSTGAAPAVGSGAEIVLYVDGAPQVISILPPGSGAAGITSTATDILRFFVAAGAHTIELRGALDGSFVGVPLAALRVAVNFARLQVLATLA
jgi:hypothetical protein